ncbi:MAG: hypothetical protein GXO16_05840 [Epsilonproteobacteria bacterium]|nr:hypothetical protein [Campylobacterota bacterium]
MNSPGKYPGLTKKAIRDIAGSIIAKISDALQNGEEVRITGFASFRVQKRKGETIKVFDFKEARVKEIELKRNIVSVRVSKKAR